MSNPSYDLNELSLLYQGKVRNIYDIDDETMLIVTTDRVSAFDVIFKEIVPERGKLLNEISNFWFQHTQHIIPNHLSDKALPAILNAADAYALTGRAQIVEKLTPIPIEAVVRGYIIGGGWQQYQQCGSICGITLPQNMQLAQKFKVPLYTPATKAKVGEHDENMSFKDTTALLGEKLAHRIREVSMALYAFAYEYALKRGIIIADTKFEFGIDSRGTLKLMDEVLTPDSSRFWDAGEYTVGTSPQSFDKQILRDYLQTLHWDKSAPPPPLPPSIISRMQSRYMQVRDRLLA